MQQQLKKLEEWLGKRERRSVTLLNDVSDGSEASPSMIGMSTTFNIPIFDATGPWELYHKQFEAADAHTQ